MNSDNNGYRNQFFRNAGDDELSIQNNEENVDVRQMYDDNFRGEYTKSFDETPHVDSTEYVPPRKPKKKLKKILIGIAVGFLGLILAFLILCWVLSLTVPDKTNFLIMATDENGTRTDTLMLGTFDKSSKKMTIISIPRDTYITVSDENFEKMNEEYPQPGSKSMKINTVHHFAGPKYGVAMVKDEVQRLMNVKIDYYVKVDFDAFRYIIDSIGGIEFYVPQDMQYSDPYQNLEINLKEGNQRLNGEQAEHLLRYRSGYADADLGRIKVQQDFMKAFIGQTLSKGTILSNPGVYLKALFKYDYIETDAGFFDIASYAMVIGGINSEKMETFTLPGSADMVAGQSVYRPNVAEIANLVSKIMDN